MLELWEEQIVADYRLLAATSAPWKISFALQTPVVSLGQITDLTVGNKCINAVLLKLLQGF